MPRNYMNSRVTVCAYGFQPGMLDNTLIRQEIYSRFRQPQEEYSLVLGLDSVDTISGNNGLQNELNDGCHRKGENDAPPTEELITEQQQKHDAQRVYVSIAHEAIGVQGAFDGGFSLSVRFFS